MSQTLLTDLLTPDRIRVSLDAQDKPSLIEELCAFLATSCGVGPEEEAQIRDEVFEREMVLSTGIGNGVAIPHGKTEVVDDLLLVAGRTKAPVDFDALDERPVRLVLVVVGPQSAAGLHLKVLSRNGGLLRSPGLRAQLEEAGSAEAFHGTLRQAETAWIQP